jgi:uroporphyrinogen-III synthase
LKHLLPSVPWHNAKAIATHDRIAQAARQLGIAQVVVCKPAVGAVLSSLESLA